ncbi:MAG: ferredoxin--NADP reductase [Acidobacteria bacterium]|nr:ferredoxin--NADP reductase [Acidobacteriota bacterium]
MAPPKPDLPQAEVVERHDITGDLFILKLKPGAPFTFRPGQYTTLGLDGVERAYSIVSAPHEPLIEVFVELVPPPEGKLTPRMHRLEPGDRMAIRPRGKGVFTLAPDRPDQLMVATVTGIAPFISMVRDRLHRGENDLRFLLLHGASYQDEFAYRPEMESLARRFPGRVVYIPTVSRPAEARNRGWAGLAGRVNTLVESQVERFHLRPESTRAYACGHPGMIRDVQERLGRSGFEVKEEKYWTE